MPRRVAGPTTQFGMPPKFARFDIDFGESRCCLARTEWLLRSKVMNAMQNAQIVRYAASAQAPPRRLTEARAGTL